MVENFSLPSPEQSGYYDDPALDAALLLIKDKIAAKIFSFCPTPGTKYASIRKINQKINSFGWELKIEWSGTKEEGDLSWKLIPYVVELDNPYGK